MGEESAGGQLSPAPQRPQVARQPPLQTKDFVDYLLRNELAHVEASPSTRARQEVRQQKLIHRLELLQARDEGNRLLY
jgi:hypothetical protein